MSKQTNASRITPNKQQTSKIMSIKDNKDLKDVKSTKINKVNVPKPSPMIAFKGLSKQTQYSYNTSSSKRNMETKPSKQLGVLSKFVAELSESKQ